MEELRELVSIVNGNKVKHLEILRPSGLDKCSQLYSLLLAKPEISEEDAVLFIYNDIDKRANFRQLKSRLRKKLINSLFLLDVNRSSSNETNVAHYESFRYWAAVKILIQKRAYKTGLVLAEKLYNYSVKYEFSELTVSISRDLRRIYGTERRNDRKYKKYTEAFDKYYPIYILEIEAEEVVIALHRIISKKTNSDYSSMSSEFFEKIMLLTKKNIDSFLFNKYFYIASIYHEQLNGNYSRIINICHTAIEYFKSKNYPAEITLSIFYNRMVIAMLNTHRYQEATDKLKVLVTRSNPGEANWHLSMVLYFLVRMYTSDYKSAQEVYLHANKKKNVKKVRKNILEIWHICNAYLQFLRARQKLIINEADKTRFSINKFLNEVPQYSKDKQGLNVAIHIIHILFLIHLRKIDAIIDRMESLQLYTYRHLRRDATFRSNCFIKMLIQIPKGNFTRKRVERYADKYWQKLQTAPLDVNHQQTTLEIIPYEPLWEMVLEMLD